MADQSRSPDTLARLEATIAARRMADPASSYVASLNARGLPVMARKLGEEATEAVVAALTGSAQELAGEAADLLFHLLVLLGARDIPLADVLAELDRREGTSGIAEKGRKDQLMPIDTSLPYDDDNIFARILRGELPLQEGL